MYYVITEHGVLKDANLKRLCNQNHILVEKSEFISVGADYVTKVTNQDLDFLQDKARVSNIMFGNFFRKDSTTKIFVIVNLILTALILFIK